MPHDKQKIAGESWMHACIVILMWEESYKTQSGKLSWYKEFFQFELKSYETFRETLPSNAMIVPL